MAGRTGLKEVVGSVVLALLAQPIHEFGHAVALRASTGVWPRIGALSVQPLVPLASNGAALAVLAAGDVAVLVWWTLVFVWMQRGRQRDWAIIGPTFVLLVVLLEWLTAAVMLPFGRSNLGSSDARKVLEITGIHPRMAATVVSVGVILVGSAMTLLLRGCGKLKLRKSRSGV